jgi:hypothetical protein
VFVKITILNVTIISTKASKIFCTKITQDNLNKLKSGLIKQQNIFHSLSEVNETVVKARYVLSSLTALNPKPFAYGQFIKECLVETAKIVCPFLKYQSHM